MVPVGAREALCQHKTGALVQISHVLYLFLHYAPLIIYYSPLHNYLRPYTDGMAGAEWNYPAAEVMVNAPR